MSENKRSIYSKMPIFGSKSSEFSYKPLQQIERSSVTNSGASHVEQNIQQSGLSVNINLDGSADQLLTEFESSAAEEEQGIEYFSEGTSSVKNCSVEQVTNVKDKAEFTQIMKQQNIMLSHCMESAILLPEHDVNSLTDYEELVCSGEEDAEYTEDNNSPIELDIEVSDLTKKYGELHVECVKDNSDVNLSQLATNEIKTKLFSSLQRRPQIPYITSVPEICFSLGQTSETDEIVNESNFKTLVNSEEMILPFDNVRETHVGDMIVSEEHKHQLDKSECKSHISVCENLWRIEECFVDLVKSKDELRAKTRIKGKDHQVNTETEDISSLGDEVEELVNEKFNNQDIGAVNVDSEFIKIFENTRVKSSSKCQSDVTFFFGKRHNDEVDDVGYHRRLTLPVIEKESTTDTEELSDVEQEHVINTKDCRLFNELQRPLFSVAFLPLRRLSYEVTTDIEELSEDDRIHRDSSMSINHNQQKCNVKSKKLSSVHHLNVVILSKMKDKTANVIEKSPRNVRSCTLAPLSLRSKQQVGMEQTTDDKFLYKDKKLRNDKNNMKGNPQKAYTQIQNLSASYHSLLLSDIIKEPVTDVEDLSEDDDKKEETSYKKSFVPDAFLPFNDIFQEQTTDIEELSGNEVQLDEKPHTSYRQLRKPFGPDAILKLNDMLQEQIIHVEKLSRYEEELDEKFQTSYRLLRKQSASDAFLTLNDMSQEPVTDVEELSGNEKELDEKPHTSCRRLRKPVASDVFLTLNDMLQEPVNGTELSGNEELDKKPQASYRWLRKSSASDEFLIPNYMLQEQITDVEELRGDEETAVKKPQTVYRQLRKPLYPDVFLSLYDVLQEPIAEVEKLSGIKEEVDKKPHTSYRWLQKPFAPDACLRLNDMLQEPVTDVEELSGNEEELDKKTQPSYRWLRKPSASDAFLSLYDMLQESITEVEELSGNEEDLDKKTQPSYRWLRRPSTHDAFLILNDNYSKNSINIDRDVTSVELSLKELQDSRKYSSVLLEDEDENQPFSRVTSVGTDSEDIIASEEEKDIMRNYHRSTVLHFEQNPYFTTEEKRKCVFPQSIDEERLSKECLYSITDLSDAITESEDMFFSDCEIPVYYFENSSCHLDSNLKVKYSDNSAVSSLGSETSTPHRNYLKVPISDVDLHTYTEDMFFSDISDSRSRSNSQQSESLHKEPESSEIAEQLKIQKIGKNYEKCIQKTKSRRKNKNDFRSSVDISIQHSEILSRAYIREKENSACVCIVPYNGNVINNVDPELNVCINKRNEEVEIKLQPENFEQNLEFLNDDVPSATAWAEKDESGAVQHTIQKEKQSTFTVKDGQSESHPGTESGDTTVSSSSSVVSKINQELKHEERGLSFTEKRDFFQKLSETYDSQAKKIDPSLDFTFHDGVDSDIQKSKDYDIQKIQMEIEHYPQKSEIIEEHKSFKERLHFFKTSIGESDQSGFPKGNIPTETSTKGMPKDIPENERKHKTDFTETVIKDTAVPASEFSEMFPEIVSNVGNEMRRKENISELAPKEQRMQKLCEVEENIQQELIKNHNGFALEMSAISDELSPLSDVIVKEGLQETFEEKSVQEISQTSLDEKVLVKPKQSIIDHEQLLIDWDLKQLEMQQDRVDKKILSDINTTVIDNKYLISSHSEEGDISEKNETLTKTKFEELKLSETEECKLKLEVSKTVKEEESLDMRKTEQTVLEQERFLSERNLEYQELQREEEMQDTELIQKFEDIQVSFEKEFPISISNTTEQIEKDFMYCLEEPRSTLAEDHLSKELETTKLEYTKQACSLTSESSTESFIQGEQFSTEKYETISMKKEIEQAQKNVSFNSEEEEREMLEKELEQTSLKDVEQQATSMLSEVSKESLVVEIGTTCDSEKTSEEDELWKEVEDSNESVKKEADSFEIDSQSPTEKERLDKQIISDASLSVTSTDLSRLPEQFVQKDKTESKTYREIIKDLKKESVIEIDDKQSVFSNQKSPSVSLTSQAFAPDSTVHQPQAASDTERESSHIEPAFPCTEHKHFSHEDKESPLSRPSPPETASYCAEREISPAADYTVYLVPEMQVHVGVSPTESKPATSERDKDEEKHIKKLEGDFCSKLVSEPLSETVKKPLTTSSPKKTYSEIQRTEYVYGSKGLKSSDDIEDVSSKTYQVQTWTETAGTHLSEISQGSELDIAFYETPVGYENTAFAGVDVIDEPALEEQDSGRATSPYEVLRPSTPTLPTGQDKTVNMDQEIFSQFSKRNIDTSKNDTKTHVEHHIKSQIFNEELDLSIEENTPEKKDILEEKSMRQTEVDRNMIVAQQIRSEIFAHELAEDIESDLPEGKDIPHDRENAENMRKIKIGAYEEKEEIMDQIISRYDMNIAQPNDKQVYENEFSEENISFIEKSEWEQKSKVVAVEHVMWETSVQQGSEEIIEEVVKELPREKQIIVEHEENESLEDSIDEENRDDEVIFSLRKEATKVAQDIIEDIKTEVSRCHTLEHSLSEISDEDLVEKSEEYMLSHQEVENLLKTRDKPEEKRVSFSEDIPEIPQITTEEIETLECDQIHTEEEECKSELEHYAHFKEIVLSSEQKVHQKETVKGEDSYIESKSSNGIKCEKEKEKYTIEAPKLPNELQKTLAQATGEKTDNFSQCLSSFEETRSDDKVVTFTNTEKETKEEIANIMTSEITLFEKVTEELKEKESDLLSTHAEDDEKMYKESIVEKLQKQDYMSSTPVILYEKQEEKTPSEEQLEFSSISTYTHVEKCISDDFIKTEKDKEIFDINLTPGENMQILERKHEFSQQPGGEYFDVNKETSVKKSELSENTTYRDIQSFTQQKESIILDSSEELTKSLYECDQLMKDEKKTTSGQKSTIHYKSEDSSFESVDLQEKAVIRDQTISEATVKSDDEKKNEYDKLEKFTSGRTTDLSELSNSTRKEKQINREGETYSSSGETDSHYYSFEMSDSGRTPRETPATSRPCSSEFDINISAPISSEYETCATSQEASGDISGSYSTAYTSQEISFATAHSSLSHSSQESAVSVDSESSGHLASVEISSEASETLVPSAQEIEQEFGRDVETPTPDGDEMAQAFIVREPYDSEIPEEVIRGGVEVPFLSDWKTKESFEASYQQSSGVIFSKWSNISELCEIPSSPFEIITEEDLADYPGDYVEHISESKCLDTYKTEESKLKDIHKLDKNSKEIKSHESILEHTTTDVVVVNETVQRTVGSEGQRSIYDEQTPILDGQLFSDEHALRSSIYRQESGAYLAAESVDDLTDQMSCSQEELSASESSVTHSEQTWLSSSVETTILATEQQVWPCSGAVSQDQQVTETMHIFTEQQFSTPELPDVVSEQPPEHSPHPSDLMLYPQLNGPVEVDYVPEYDATYPESQEQETEVESTFAEGTSTFAVTGESNSSDTQDISEQTSLVETTRNVLLSGTEISAFLPSQIHQPESERVYAESQELQPPAVSLGHTVSEQYSESDSSEGDIQDIQTIQEIQELQEQEYGQEYETCRAEADEVYFQYYQRQYEENEEETQNFPCEVDKTVDWPESELLEEFYKSDKIAEVSDDQVDSEIKSVLSHAVESEQQKDLEDIERPMSPEPPYYSSLGEDDSYLPESDQGSAFLQKNISSAQETSLSHTSTTSTTQFAATEITSESISTDQQLVTCTESFSKQFQTDSHTSESFEIMDKNEVVDTKPEEDTYDIIFENQIQAVSSIEKSSSSKIQQGDIMEESLLSKAQKSCGQQCLTESHIATAVAEKFTIQAHQAYKHDIELDSDFQSKNMMEEDKDDKSSGEKVKYTCGIQFEIKKQHDLEEDSFGELYTHREEDEDGLEEIERASKTKPSFCEEINSSDLGVFADRKYTSKSEQDDKSVLSLQEFEKLELDVTIGQKSSLGLGDLVFDKTVLSKSEEVDDISLCSQTEFEQLEKECEEVGHEPTKEDFSKPFEIKESYHVQEITEDAASSESDDYEKRMSEIDEIIRQAQTNVEQFHSDHDQSLSESTGFTVKLQKYTGALSSESTESSLMEKTSSQKDDHDIDSLNGNEILERQASVEGYILETNEESIIHELETRPALLHHITVGRTVSGHSAESCDSQPRSSTSTVTQYDIESLREREAELEETEAVGDLKSRFFTDQRVEKYKTLVEHKDFMHEESDHFFCEDSIYEKKEIHAEESSLLSDKSADVDSLLEERADKDSLQEERDVDQDSLHEEMDLPDDQEDVLPGAQKASKQVIIKSSWHQRHLSDDECDKDSLKDEYLAGQDTSSSGKDGKDSGGKGDCMISSTDSLEPSSSTATHATYQFETDSVMSSSVNSVHTSGEESTMVSSTDTIEPEVVLSYSVGDMTEAAESHLIFSRNQVESQLQLKSEIRSLVKDADKNYKTIISQSMTQPSQLVICLSEEGTKPHMSHDGEQMLGKDAEMLSAGELSENYEIEAKDESKNQVVIHPVEEYIVCPEKLDSTVSEADVKEQLKDFIEKQASGVTYSNEPQKDHSVDEKGNLYITKMVKQHLKSEPQVMNYLDEETPEPSVASYVKKSFEAEKNIAVIEELSERKEENEIMDARGNQVIIHHNKDDIHQANHNIADSERVVEKHVKDCIPKQTIDIDYGDDEVEGHHSVDEKENVVITKTVKDPLKYESQGPEDIIACHLVTHIDDKNLESGSTSDAVEAFETEKDVSITFKDKTRESVGEIKTTDVKRNISYKPTISNTDNIEERLKELLKKQTLGVGKDQEEVEEHQKVDEKGNVIITRTVKRHVTSEPQIHKKTFIGPDAEKQTKEFFQSFDSLKPTEDEDHYEGVDEEGNMIRVTQKFVVKPEIHTVTFTGPDAHKQMEYFMKTWNESQDDEKDSNDAYCHRVKVYTNDPSGEGEKTHSFEAEPQYTQSQPVYSCASSFSKMHESDGHQHISSDQTDQGLESDPVFHLKTQEPTSAAGQMLDSGTHQFHYRDVSDGVPLPASLTRHTVYPQDERTVQFDPRECDHEFHSKLLSHFISEEENKEFGSDDWQQDSGDGHWTDQSTTEVRLETTHTTTTVGAVTETTTQHSDINKQDSLQQSMQEILNQFMTDEGSSQTVYHFDNDKE